MFSVLDDVCAREYMIAKEGVAHSQIEVVCPVWFGLKYISNMACVYGYAKVLVFTRTASTHVGDICEVIFQKCHIPSRDLLGNVLKLRAKMFLIQTTHYNAVRIQAVCVKGWQFFMSNGDNHSHITPAVRPDTPDDDSPLKPLSNIIYVKLICPEGLLHSRSSDDGARGILKLNDKIGQEIATKAEDDEGVIIK